MRLYHFTAAHLLPSIRREGLTRGFFVRTAGSEVIYDTHRIWLTSSPDWRQPWCDLRYSSLPFDRTATRILLSIPEENKPALERWVDIAHSCPLAVDLNAFCQPQDWWLYNGRIPPEWFEQIDLKPAALAREAERYLVRNRHRLAAQRRRPVSIWDLKVGSC